MEHVVKHRLDKCCVRELQQLVFLSRKQIGQVELRWHTIYAQLCIDTCCVLPYAMDYAPVVEAASGAWGHAMLSTFII